jgi:chromosomal replication initiator protein
MKGHRQRRGAGRKEPVPDAFLAGPENQLAEAAVRAVLDGPSPRYNPLVFYGNSGTGKSHLAHGLAAAWQARRPRKRVEVTHAKDFARELLDAVEAQAVDDLRLRFRTADLVVFEQLELLAEHRAAQEELMATLDVLLADGRQVVGTANAAPGQLAALLPGLRSRLCAGLAVPLSPPGPAARSALLERLAAAQDIAIDASAVRLLAEGVAGTVPELLGVLRQLQFDALSDGTRIGAEQIRRFLAARGSSSPPSIAEIAAATARCFSVSVSDLRSPSRARAVVTARDVAMYVARQLTGESLQRIGRHFGGRDHTTVLHGCRKVELLTDRDPAIRESVETLLRKWNGVA